MQFGYSPYILPLIVAALVSVVVAAYAWTNRSVHGDRALSFLSLAIAIWASGYALEVAGTDLNTKYVGGVCQYIGIAFAPYLWLIFSIEYSNTLRVIPRRFFLTVLIPTTTVLFALTTKWHGLVWSEYHIQRDGDFSALAVSYGPWFYVHFAFSYISLLIGTILLARALWRNRHRLYQAQIILLLVSVLTPWVGNVVYLTGNSPLPYLDLTPFAFTVTVAALAWAVFGFRLGDISPIARDMVVEGMRDGVIVLDARDRIVDINSVGARMIGVPAVDALGKTAEDVFSPWPHLIERFRDVLEADDEIVIGKGEAQRRMRLRLSPLYDQQEKLAGRVLILYLLEEGSVPRPRFASEATAPLGRVRPEVWEETEEGTSSRQETKRRIPAIGWVVDFFRVPIKADLKIPSDTVPPWFWERERIFTLILRFLSVCGSVAVIFSIPFMGKVMDVVLTYALLLGVLWFLGLYRSVNYYSRVYALLLLMFAVAFIETLNFGYSVEGFTVFMVFIVTAVSLVGKRAGLYLLLASLVVLGTFGWLIGSGNFIPSVVLSEGIPLVPSTLQKALTSTATFAAGALALVFSIASFTESMGSTWQRAIQMSNLLQQERDLLEQRVRERTADLHEAHDLALQSRDELRTYYQAIEQSGSSIVITDAQGNIEYVNPQFEKVTGYSSAEAIGQNPRILKSGEQSLEFYRRMWETIASGEIWQGEFLNKRKDGSLYWEFATIAPVKDEQGKILHYVAIKEDITAQKELRETLARQNQYLAALQNITLELLDRRNRQELLNNILQRARDTLHASLGAIALWEDGQLVFRAVAEDRHELYGQPVSRESMPLVWKAFEQRLPVVVDDYAEKYGEYQVREGQILHAAADFPIISANQVLGVIALGRSETNFPFSPAQIEFGQSLAQIAALVLDSANLYDSALRELEERKKIQASLEVSEQEQRALASILQIGMSEESLESILLNALDSLLSIQWLGLEAKGGVFLKKPQSESLLLKVQRNLSPETCSLCAQVKFGQCLCGRAAQTRELQFSSHLDDLHETTYEDIPDHGHYNVPILSGESVLGVVVLYLPPGYAYDERDVRFLQAFASTLSNIIRRKQTEELLRESEIRFRQIVENAGDIIYRTDALGHFVYVNPVAINLMGFHSEAEVLGRHYLELAHPEWRTRLQHFYVRQFTQRIPNTYYEFEAVAADGRKVWIGQNVQIICQNNVITGFQAVARDITELKETQKALEEARDQALEASAFKSQLLSRVSHELRTPLGGVLGYAELMQSDAFGALNDQQREATKNIIDSAHYLSHMVNDLLNEAEIVARAVKLQNDWFFPAELLEKASASLSVHAVKKGLSFFSECSPDLPQKLFGDARRLQQIIINLAGNAIKFTERGEVRVRLTCPAPDQWAIVVSDTGAGIPKKAQGYIFDPFRQVDNRITRKNRGSGLGLSITKHLVELMGGQITLDSEIGKGSVFTVTLPILDASGEPLMNKPYALVIEDDPVLSRVYIIALQEAGFDAALDINGNQYPSLIAARQPALVLLDLHLPYASGADILNDLRDKFPAATIAVVTADFIKAKSLPDKADHILIKPVSVERLKSVAEQAKKVNV